ncbi:MAG: DUF1553 domain-containing protein [Verrucomicrobiales bacterium]
MFTKLLSRKQAEKLARYQKRPGRIALPAILLASAIQGSNGAETRIDFNRDVRPILSENCFLCHGPDEETRKGKLRLDIRDEALKPASSGEPAIVPGAPEKSLLIARVTHADPDELMPPVKLGKTVTSTQIETLKKWIAEGANYAEHWAYVPPHRPELPKVKKEGWARNGVDYFVQEKVEKAGLSVSQEADLPTLGRRVALDLTGLPPTPEEIDSLLNDPSPNAFENYVDVMLGKQSFGEHWARLWLDLARYADSAGYADDPLRSMWGYRDYVIRAFNENKPFDQFTVEQIAGDLLPEPSEDQIKATAFHRNTMTNSEGGTNDEEFRNAAVVDRVNTTMAVWMGTSMACAQCHTHKYDPISQEEYFQFMAFFNNTEDADRFDEAPTLLFYTRPQQEKREKLGVQIAALEHILKTPRPEYEAGFTQWDTGFPTNLNWTSLAPSQVQYSHEPTIKTNESGQIKILTGEGKETYTIDLALKGGSLTGLKLEALPDDALPGKGPGNGADGNFVISRVTATLRPPVTDQITARFIRIEIPGKEKILSLAEAQVFQGDENIAAKGEATQSSTQFGGDAKLAIDGKTDGDYEKQSTTHTSISENPWWEVDLKSSQSINRIVLWNRTDNDLQKRLKDFRIIAYNDKREVIWQKDVSEAPNPSSSLAVDGSRTIKFTGAFADVSEEESMPLTVIGDKADPKKGWSPGKTDGKNHWLALVADKVETFPAGSTLRVVIEQNSERKNHTVGSFKLQVTEESALINYKSVAPSILALFSRGNMDRPPEDQNKLLLYYLRNIAPELATQRNEVAALQKSFDEIKAHTVPILRELAGDKRRKTNLHHRGNFADLGKEVTEAVPVAFHPLPEGAEKNRLTLARWLVDSKNSLTARVVANRFWEQIFGIGLVRTSEEFGSQGEPPTHPELLDWLALELQDNGWDVKKFLKLLVTSSTYRQTSKVTPELAEHDPENLLLARGPRFRMSAEMVRDQALFVSGLLSPKMHGPSVKPARPNSGLSAAFGSSVDWKTSEGEDRYRRGLYTEWRRTSPYPSMATFDAPNREVCTLRRNVTNTPLQALVTMNDPVYLEAAQSLARKMARTGGTLADKIKAGFEWCLLREPQEKELARLVELFGETLANYARQGTEPATKLAAEPLGPLPKDADPLELASWTVVANVLLNLDETLMKR